MTNQTQGDQQQLNRRLSLSRFHWFQRGLLFLALLCAQTLHATSESKAPKNLEEAEKWFREYLELAGEHDLQFQMDVGMVTWKDKNNQLLGFNSATVTSIVLARDAESKAWRVTISSYTGESKWWQDAKRERAERFEQALRFLVQQAIQNVDAMYAANFAKFQAQADVWREGATKPKMPEDAYTHKVLAESAYHEKDLVKALIEYNLALEKFPLWPEGQFNAALIAGELKRYRFAVLHMKEYLLLVPDAPDAQGAKDKIIIWQDKITYL